MRTFIVSGEKLKDILRPGLEFIPRQNEMYGMCFLFRSREKNKFKFNSDIVLLQTILNTEACKNFIMQ